MAGDPGVGAEGAAKETRYRKSRLAAGSGDADGETVGDARVGDLPRVLPVVVVHHLVAQLQEASLLDVRVVVGGEDRADRASRRIGRGRVDDVGEVAPLDAAVLE